MSELEIMDDDGLCNAFLELVRKTSSFLPDDVKKSIKKFADNEENESRAKRTFDTILVNCDLAEGGSRPICQDTGTVMFYITAPFGVRHSRVTELVKTAIRKATDLSYLRPNVNDPITGKSKGDNIGVGHPALTLEQSDGDSFKVTCMMKGGGCENVGAQYSLPDTGLSAGRDIDGIKKVILDQIINAQGKGCSPGVLGIGIGGDRTSGYAMSKKQLLRKLDDTNQDPVLAELEEWVVDNANRLGIGPMGFGGKTTLIGAKAGVVDRLPASYFVSISYMCWAYRRRSMTIENGEVRYD